MAWKVIFSKTSRNDLCGIIRYIVRDDPAAAERFGNALIERAEGLAHAPKMGLRYQRDGTARYIVHRSYLIIYDLDERRGQVMVHRFWHGARGSRPEI